MTLIEFNSCLDNQAGIHWEFNYCLKALSCEVIEFFPFDFLLCFSSSVKSDIEVGVDLLLYDCVFGKRVLTYWENKGNPGYNHMNVFKATMENYIFSER